MEKSLCSLKDKMPCKELRLHSQTHAAPFYRKFGFGEIGEEFLEEGVPHIEMSKEL